MAVVQMAYLQYIEGLNTDAFRRQHCTVAGRWWEGASVELCFAFGGDESLTECPANLHDIGADGMLFIAHYREQFGLSPFSFSPLLPQLCPAKALLQSRAGLLDQPVQLCSPHLFRITPPINAAKNRTLAAMDRRGTWAIAICFIATVSVLLGLRFPTHSSGTYRRTMFLLPPSFFAGEQRHALSVGPQGLDQETRH